VLKSFWKLESLGIKSVEPSVHEVLKESVVFKDGRYEVTLPWQDNQIRPPSNFQLAKKRLVGLLKKLCHHAEALQEYHAVIQEQLRLGIIERVSGESAHMNNSGTHYLPHHAVIQQDKSTTKLCIV